MDKNEIAQLAADFIACSKDNKIKMENDLSRNLGGARIFDAPIFGFSDASDEVFSILKEPEVIGGHFRYPSEWLPSSKTVISFFLPFTEEVKASNRLKKIWPSWEWMVGRVEGHRLLRSLSLYLQRSLVHAGYKTVVPSMDKKFFSITSPIEELQEEPLAFTSNWSERHVAYLSGLGTFGLSQGLITKKGIAGRFGSLVTELFLVPNKRPYEIYNSYCTKCGACVKQCPVKAISLKKGKDHRLCSIFLDKTAEKFKPRYGCGKCQVNVPCESGIPVGK